MSTVSAVYDALHTRIAAILPAYKRLVNPYQPQENNELFLRKGYGVAFGPGVNEEKVISCKMAIARSFDIVLTQKYYATEHDATGKAVTEKALMEDQFLLIQDFETDVTLNGTAMMVKYQADNGIEFVERQNDKFLMVTMTVLVKYLEAL